MRTTKILAFDKKVKNEVERAIKKIYKKHNKEMTNLIANEIPKKHTLTNGNGMAFITNNEGEDIQSGKAWGLAKDVQLDKISLLQYNNEFHGGFCIPFEIKGKKLAQ